MPGNSGIKTGLLFVFAFALCAVFTSPVTAQGNVQTVSRDEGRVLAERLTEIGQPRAAREVALGLLRADPNDVLALVALARAEIVLGRTDAAHSAATAALRAAQTPFENFMASLVVAEIFAQQDQFTRSQMWIRRAQNYASNDGERQILASAFRRVRNLNPLTVHLNFGLIPSSNANSGTSNDTVTFAYLPGVFGTIPWVVPADERPLSGVQISADVSLRYRLAQSNTFQTTMDFGVYAHTYVMSDSARAAAPDVTGRSLRYGELSLGIGHQWVPVGSENLQYGASLTYKHAVNASGPVSDRLVGDFSLDRILSDTDRVSFGITLEHALYPTSDVTAQTARLRAQWVHALPEGRSLAIATTLARAASEDNNRDYSSASLALSYSFGEVLPQVDLSTTLRTEWRRFDSVTLDPSGRDDVTTSLNIEAGLAQFEFYGFQPVVSLRAQRNDSSVPSYDTEALTLGLNFRSSF